ncbi:MAG: putative sugar nucleotidyl transferase [Bacteroidota bacterium]
MIHLVLFDTPSSRLALYPLSLTRPVCDIRFGILTLREWWSMKTGSPVYAITEAYLQEQQQAADVFINVDATVLPGENCILQVLALKPGEILEDEMGLIAYASASQPVYNQLPVWPEKSIQAAIQPRLRNAWQLFQGNANRITADFELLTKNRSGENIAASNTVIGNGKLFLEEGADMQACTINVTEGPVYIGRNALVMEGTLIRGPVSIGEGAVVKMGTKLYPGTTIGLYCTAGGEIKNSILMGFSNKAHDGYLGDSVIGEWCNFGAGSSNSNVKNTGGEVKMWKESTQSLEAVGIKAGLVMGDYSRCAINSSFNTGTTVGVSCNVFDGTYPNKHLPSFSWGNHEKYQFHKACLDAANWKKMKGKEFTGKDRLILQHIFEIANSK